MSNRLKRRPRGGPFICSLCGRGFSRRATVKDPHHEKCVKKNGNPYDLPWDAHESCWIPKNGGPVGGPIGGPSWSIPRSIEHPYNDSGAQTQIYHEGAEGLIKGVEDHNVSLIGHFSRKNVSSY